MRKRLLIIGICLFIGQVVWALDNNSFTETDKERIEIEKWMVTYYQHPNPNAVLLQIQKLASLRELASSDRKMSIMAFLTQIFKQNPQDISPWMKQLNSLSSENKKLLMMSIWQSNTKEGKAYIETIMRDKTNPLSLYAKELAQTSPVNLLNEDIKSPVGLDMLWSSFYASGDPRYVEKIINMISWEHIATDGELDTQQMDKLMTVSVARWSLVSNALQQPAIYNIIKSYYAKANPEIRPVLVQLLETILVQKAKNAQ